MNDHDQESRTVYLTENEIRAVIAETVSETLTKIGVEHDDPHEMQKDFHHLREWRKASTEIRTKSMITVLTVIIAGGLGALWLGFKTLTGGND
jgi:hypothetical protein